MTPKQVMFRKDMELNYQLSPYAVITPLTDSRVSFLRTDTGRFVTFQGSGDDVLKFLCKTLSEGIGESDLHSLLQNMGIENPDEWIQMLIQEGILE